MHTKSINTSLSKKETVPALMHVLSYMFQITEEIRQSLLDSAMHLRDDFQISSVHRLSPIVDSLWNIQSFLLFLVTDHYLHSLI